GRALALRGHSRHAGGGYVSEDSSKPSRRRGRRSRGGAKDETEGGDHGAEENGDVHRLEDDETSRAQARATIASIAAASSSASAPTEDADGPSASSPQDPAGKA